MKLIDTSFDTLVVGHLLDMRKTQSESDVTSHVLKHSMHTERQKKYINTNSLYMITIIIDLVHWCVTPVLYRW